LRFTNKMQWRSAHFQLWDFASQFRDVSRWHFTSANRAKRSRMALSKH
jgi:hypothetical protein